MTGTEVLRFGPRAMLTSAGIGFVIGIVVTLAFAPLALHTPATSATNTHERLPTPVALSEGKLHADIVRLANQVLVVSNLGHPRVEQVGVVRAPRSPGQPTPDAVQLYNASITFQLNPNPFGPSAQVRSAKADCFLLIKALYTHALPISAISLTGTFRFPNQNHAVPALRAGIDGRTAAALTPWSKLGRGDESRVWQLLRPHWISQRFQRYHLMPTG